MLKPERNKDDRQKTKTVKMGQCPRWNETIVFNNINKIDMNVKELEIAIMWLDKSSKTYLGSIRLTNHEGLLPLKTQNKRNFFFKKLTLCIGQ